MSYQILRTDKFNDQLYEIIHYIADDSGDVNVALGVLDKIEYAVLLLADIPLMGTQPRYSILRKQDYRVLIIDRHLVFYKAVEQQKHVILYAIVDGRREYLSLI